ncbi:hypothetical protein ATCC90586_001279 [Pythium insidiosum]|nr:hypothetical protein ATCC90586_001279 [Pythium insidiosum]
MGNGASQTLHTRHSDSRVETLRQLSSASATHQNSTFSLRLGSIDYTAVGNAPLTASSASSPPALPASSEQAARRAMPRSLAPLSPTLQAFGEIREEPSPGSSAASIVHACSNNDVASARSEQPQEEEELLDDPYADEIFEDDVLEWKKGEVLGSGSYGTVYLARNERSGALMAAKEILVAEETEADVRSASREVELLRSLRHENVVKYLGSHVDAEAKKLYIFTEWVPGGNLEHNRKRFGGDERVVRRYTKQILQGVAYLHSKHIVHHDIKPSNLLVDQNGVVKLADFGSSRLISSSTYINNESMRGTPNYMAPEVIKQTSRGRKSDIWSVGCSVLRLLTGRPLWGDKKFDSQVALLFFIANLTELPPLPGELSADARSFLLQCLEIDPARRPSAEELLRHPFVVRSGVDPENPEPSPRQHERVSPSNAARSEHAPASAPAAVEISRPKAAHGARVRPHPATALEQHEHSVELPSVSNRVALSANAESGTVYTFSEFSEPHQATMTDRRGYEWEDRPIETAGAKAERERQLARRAEERRQREERERRYQEELVEFRQTMLGAPPPQQ